MCRTLEVSNTRLFAQILARCELICQCSLLPPYRDHHEESWKNYYEQRAALDEVNTPENAAADSIISEELGQDTWKLLRKASDGVAAVIYGAALEDEGRKVAVARTLRGSLYYCDLWGNDEEGRVLITMLCAPILK